MEFRIRYIWKELLDLSAGVNLWSYTSTPLRVSRSPCTGTTLLFGRFFTASGEESSWNVMAHGDAREGKWRGNRRMEWISSTLYTTSEHGVSSITTADVHTSAASSRLNWRPRRFKWTRPFRRKTKSVFCACAITFQTQSTTWRGAAALPRRSLRWGCCKVLRYTPECNFVYSRKKAMAFTAAIFTKMGVARQR
jgi:hypothetical protein